MSWTPANWSYRYEAMLTRVIDGDTIVVDLDLGCGTFIRGMKVRLADYNAPEMPKGDKKGDSSQPGYRAYWKLQDLLGGCGSTVYLEMHKITVMSFDRYVARAFCGDRSGSLAAVAYEMRSSGFDVPLESGKPLPVFYAHGAGDTDMEATIRACENHAKVNLPARH